MSQVFSLLTGAAPATGFRGLGHKFKRKDLLKFSSEKIDPQAMCFEFRRLDNGKAVLVRFYPQRIPFPEEKAKQLSHLLQPVIWEAATEEETKQFQGLWMEKVEHMLMMVDTTGKIMYTGPVGGFLPRLLLEKELVTAVADTHMALPDVPALADLPDDPNAIPVESVTRAAPGMKVARDESGDARRTLPERIEPEKPSASAPNERSADNEEVELADDINAERLMEMARVQKRLSPRNALKYYDEVLERFPHTQQARRAKIGIRSILRSKPRFRKERQEQGKYVGE